MGASILTPHQSQVLELVGKTKNLTDRFYLTGGTALSEFYLKHRLSVDLDFFSEEEFEMQPIEAFFKKHSPVLEIIKTELINHLGLNTFFFTFKDKTVLKVDFSYYPFPRIEKGFKFLGLDMESFFQSQVKILEKDILK